MSIIQQIHAHQREPNNRTNIIKRISRHNDMCTIYAANNEERSMFKTKF